jgi:inner membrane protein
MTTRPHLIFGLFAGAVITSVYQMADAAFTTHFGNLSLALVAVSFGSLFPDIDIPTSPASRLFFFIAKPLQSYCSHRGAMHSLAGAFLTSFIVFGLTDWLVALLPLPHNVPAVLSIFFLGGLIGHCVVDTLTVSGIRWIYPYQRPIVYPTNPRYRITTGNIKAERKYTFLFLCMFLVWLPIVVAGGATRSIHKTFRNYQMAKADYLGAANIETFLAFKGSYRHDRVPVSGRGLILDATSQYFIIYFDDKVQTIGDQALILGTEFVCEYTEAAPEHFEFSVVNQPMDSVLTKIPDDVLLSGELVSNKEYQATSPIYTTGDFPTIKVTSSNIGFAYAGKKEASLLNVRIPQDVRTIQIHVRTLERDIRTVETEIASLIEKRSSETKLIIRHNLQKRIEELRSKRKTMEKSLENKNRQLEDYGSPIIEFSGKLSFRKLP